MYTRHDKMANGSMYIHKFRGRVVTLEVQHCTATSLIFWSLHRQSYRSDFRLTGFEKISISDTRINCIRIRHSRKPHPPFKKLNPYASCFKATTCLP